MQLIQTKIEAVKSKYGNAIGFMTQFAPEKQLYFARNRIEALNGDYPSLAILKRSYGAEIAEAWICIQLENLNMSTNIPVKLNESMQNDLAVMIMTDYYYLKISELQLFFYRLKTGAYVDKNGSTFYGSIDPIKIMECLGRFRDERIAEIKRYEREEQQEKLQRQREEWERAAATPERVEEIRLRFEAKQLLITFRDQWNKTHKLLKAIGRK